MAKCSKAVEILPGPSIEWLIGSTKHSTARICKNGRNIATPKVKQPNKTGGDPNMFRAAGEKWRSMTNEEKQPWIDLVQEKNFRSGWHAFNSSFFRSVAIHGLEYTINHELNYIESNHRQKKAQHLLNSLKRLQNYQVQESFYTETDTILAHYPVALSSSHFYIRLEDITDVNNALSMKYLYRTDSFKEYKFKPVETDQDIETGTYTLRIRPRLGQELYEPIY